MDSNNSRYLMIQNEGVCPVEGFTMFGVSTARDSDIGQFGSGNKHGVNVCLRHDITPTIYCGNLRLHFLKIEKVMHGINPKTYNEVHCHFSGRAFDGRTVDRQESLSIALEYGNREWTELAMALREFISNAIDQTAQRINGTPDWPAIIREGKLAVRVVEANQVRAKSGYTRIFLPYTPEVQKFYDELHKRFLHFSEPQLLNSRVLEKRGRNINGSGAMIYRRGVFVREVEHSASLFDYNFDGEITLNESRNVDDYTVKIAAVKAIRDADTDILRRVFLSLLNGNSTWESSFDSYYLTIDNFKYGKNPDEVLGWKARWQDAWKLIAPDEALAYQNDEKGIGRARRKGMRVHPIASHAWVEAATANGLPTPQNVLTAYEQKGYEIIDAQGHAEALAGSVWRMLTALEMTKDKPAPALKCFRVLPDGFDTTCFLDEGTLFINTNADFSESTTAHVLEETVRHIAGEEWQTRMMLAQLAAKMAAKLKLFHF